ncbi:MAG TPA: hypothetical protein VHA75_11395 [Rugosimonospora sp.]|nr:hypothetical protein [Rugosimonospora sp.]
MSVDGLDQGFARAALGLLGDAGLTVYDGQVADGVLKAGQPVPPYVSLWCTLGPPQGDPDNPVGGGTVILVASWYCTCVGDDAKAVRAVQAAVRAALQDAVPVPLDADDEPIAGVVCGQIYQVEAGAPGPSNVLGFEVSSATAQYDVRASIA